MKILITGAAGYIGSCLVDLYNSISHEDELTLLDLRFPSERKQFLESQGMKCVECNILNKKNLKKLIPSADIVYHLAGITEVPRVGNPDSQLLSEKDKKIIEVGVDGTRNILKYLRPDARIIFISSHIVFEGLPDTAFDIHEEQAPCPKLSYSTCKFQSEWDLLNSSHNYVIVRLGSNYGYNKHYMRRDIMPNLFSRIASQNGSLKLFSGGIQYKSLVSAHDVANCIKFLADSDISREIIHCSNENLTVKQVADICKRFSPNLAITETTDRIPNRGYTLSNEKLLSLGFSFSHNLIDSIEEMIYKFKTLP